MSDRPFTPNSMLGASNDGAAASAAQALASLDTLVLERLTQILREPSFSSAVLAALRGSPAFAALFAEKLTTALEIPEFRRMLASAVAGSPPFLSALNSDYAVAPFAPLFSGDASCIPPARYTPQRAARQWGHVFNTALDFVYHNKLEGDVYEFGSLHGYTARHLALALAARGKSGPKLHLFDTFTGFPALTSTIDRTSYAYTDSNWTQGGCAAKDGTPERIARMLRGILPEARFAINVGTFAETLNRLAAPNPAALVHMDCDLYESAKLVLDRLVEYDLLQDGTVIVWDDFNCARANPEYGERRAMHETFDRNPRFICEPWFAYGWHGQVSIVHERGIAEKRAHTARE